MVEKHIMKYMMFFTSVSKSTFTFMHLADAFVFNQYVCSLGIEPTTFCATDAMLYH